MIKVTKSKCVICSKNELKMLNELFVLCYTNIYELPLFSIDQKAIEDIKMIKSDYVLLRNSDNKFTESFFKRVNACWDKQYKK